MTLVFPSKSADFEPPPAGAFVGTCYRVVDLGTQETTYLGKPKRVHQILISWELQDERMKDGRPFSVHKRYTYSSSPKANLRKDLESWRGMKFADADFGSFELDRLLGVGCMLNIVHEEKGENLYANIAAIMALPRGVEKTGRHTENERLCFSLADRPFDHNGFGKLTERMQGKIKLAPEYQAAIDGRDPNEEPAPVNGDVGRYSDLDDEIPF